jgi:Helix-turn-helix domain
MNRTDDRLRPPQGKLAPRSRDDTQRLKPSTPKAEPVSASASTAKQAGGVRTEIPTPSTGPSVSPSPPRTSKLVYDRIDAGAYQFVKLPTCVLEDRTLSDSALRQYAVFMQLNANRAGGCFASLRTLGERQGKKTRAVQRAVAELVEHGLIEKVNRGFGRTNRHFTTKGPNFAKIAPVEWVKKRGRPRNTPPPEEES